MKVTADTNVLLRALVGDDAAQSHAAAKVLREAELIAIPLPCLCELVWVMGSRYRYTNEQIVESIQTLMSTHNVVMNRPAVEAGIAMIEHGGGFADGVIAFEGEWLGGETFLSFDRKAVLAATRQGRSARLLGS